MAGVMQFYGMSFDDVVELEVKWFCKLYNRISRIEAQRQMSWLPVIAYPHMNQRGADRTWRDLKTKLEGKDLSPSKLPNPASPGEVKHGWHRLRSMGLRSDG
jgi:hypothetical protein